MIAVLHYLLIVQCYAFDSGGAIFTQNSIGISNSIFGGCQAIQGNSIHIQRLSKDISLLINGSVFTGRDIYNETQYQLYSAPVYAERIKNIVITTMTEEGIVGETEGLKSNFSFFIKKDNQNQQYNQDNQFNGICGGVQIYSAEQIFFNGVVFSDIQADQGSALRIEVSVKVTLHNCEFIKCKSNGNGAVYFQIDPLIPSINLISIDCKFQECQSNQSGGAIYIEQQSKLQRNDYFSNIKNNNELQANRFSNDIDEDQESLFTISADFVQNSAQNQGGAVFIAPNIDETLSLRLKFDRCIFMHNFAADKGGSVFMDVNQSRNQFISFDFCFFIANNCSGITQNEQPDDYTRCAGAQQLLAWHIALIALGALTVVGITLGLIIFLSFRWIKRRKREVLIDEFYPKKDEKSPPYGQCVNKDEQKNDYRRKEY
ncbi:MAG: hypothetical protein EZS28_014154 [Streblomastix strix]|uniref:Right handed beta helix domain-containing protein n=1 Tax=Streblomastix strix TaxID=222440 RepID=A0A5J4W769_9EUKA|nr:MAG: hypothetical protein EZS28_014154 [Streblomastix strix]